MNDDEKLLAEIMIEKHDRERWRDLYEARPSDPWDDPVRKRMSAIEAEKRRAFAESKVRKLEEEQRKALQEAQIKQLMEMQALQAGPIFTPIRPTPELMARQIHEARCQIVAMTIMGDLYAK